jgi:hypothetical protein
MGVSVVSVADTGPVTPPITPEAEHIFTLQECEGMATNAFSVAKARDHGMDPQKAMRVLYKSLADAKGKPESWVKTDADVYGFLDVAAQIFKQKEAKPGQIYDSLMAQCTEKFERSHT